MGARYPGERNTNGLRLHMDVKSATRVLDLFEAFAESARPMSLTEISAALGIPVSSCFNLMRTLESRGYLAGRQRRGARYPTRKLLEVARSIARGDPFGARVSALLARLRDETGETVCLGRQRDLGVYYVEVWESPNSIRYIVRPGETRSLHANSVGKAILAAMDAESRDAVLDRIRYTRYSAATLANRRELEADLELGRRRGWWTNDGETEPDALGIALPCRIGDELFGVSIVAPRYRLKPCLSQRVAQLRTAVEEIMSPTLEAPGAPDAAVGRSAPERRMKKV